jgi:V8-like Glu-specific endopeptidase
VKIGGNPKIKKGDKIYVVGYPSGMPAKYADQGDVLQDDGPVTFVTDLDTFRGNSGSGVFLVKDNLLAGLLVAGATDYYPDGAVTDACYRAYRCRPAQCSGEVVTRIETLGLR